MTNAMWDRYINTWHSLIKATALWRERMYQHANGNDPIAPWERSV